LVKLCGASHNFAINDSSLHLLKSSSQMQSCGKGATDAQAQAGALLEALERYSGVFAGDEVRITASFRSLNGDAIHPGSCLLFSDRQSEQQDAWNKLVSTFSLVPLPFDDNAELEWSPVWSLMDRRFKYLPTAYLYYGYRQEPAAGMCWADSNGNAAGSSLEEAICHGIL
jgi:ribosomal protein S12 methylthiotransferase accessory factor